LLRRVQELNAQDHADERGQVLEMQAVPSTSNSRSPFQLALGGRNKGEFS